MLSECSECPSQSSYDPSGHITTKMRGNHFSSRKDPVVCYKCNEQQPIYTCNRCGITGIREAFQKTNFEQDCTRGSQHCRECKEGRRTWKVCMVEQCRKSITLEYLPHVHKKRQVGISFVRLVIRIDTRRKIQVRTLVLLVRK